MNNLHQIKLKALQKVVKQINIKKEYYHQLNLNVIEIYNQIRRVENKKRNKKEKKRKKRKRNTNKKKINLVIKIHIQIKNILMIKMEVNSNNK